MVDTHLQKNKLDPYLIPYNSRWIKDLNVRHEYIKFLEEQRGKLYDIGISNISWI